MKIVFIGGTGNISADCAAWLYERGHEIFVVSRAGARYRCNTRPFRRTARTSTGCVRRSRGVSRGGHQLPGYDVADVQLDYTLFQGVLRQYIFISSATVYAKPPSTLPLTEDAPLGNGV